MFLEDILLNREKSFISNESLCDDAVAFKIITQTQKKLTSIFQSKCNHIDDSNNISNNNNNTISDICKILGGL